MGWQAYLEKAQSNLRAAEMAYHAGEYDPAVSRAYYAVLHAEIAALIKLTDFRPRQWGHDRVQAEFNRRLIHRQKVFPTGFRFVHSDLLGRRHIADYEAERLGQVVAGRCVRKAQEVCAQSSGDDGGNDPDAHRGITMQVEVTFSGSVVSVEALVRFLKSLEQLVPAPVEAPKVVMGDDGVMYVKAGFATEDEAWRAGEQMAEVSAEIVEDTDVLVVLAPFAM